MLIWINSLVMVRRCFVFHERISCAVIGDVIDSEVSLVVWRSGGIQRLDYEHARYGHAHDLIDGFTETGRELSDQSRFIFRQIQAR